MRVLTGVLFTYIGYYQIPKLIAEKHDLIFNKIINPGINVRSIKSTILWFNLN